MFVDQLRPVLNLSVVAPPSQVKNVPALATMKSQVPL